MTRALLALLADYDREDRLSLRDIYGFLVAADEPFQAALALWREAGYPGASEPATIEPEPEPEPEPAAPSKRLVWVRVKDAWHLCRHDVPDWLTGPYSAWPDSAVAYAGHGAAVGRDEPCASTAESAALCEAWAKEDGFKPDPWPGEAP